ncbi:MAG: hypothetical protein GPJ52_03130 [Candidatus Heimdallarchaeota archaeon]|nr:hypothetical protein [Candidatus Heimdallarchaeota archaeon]
MNEKAKIFWAIFSGVLVFSSLFVLVYSGIKKHDEYLLDIKIPGIVEGTAIAIDTQKYFTRNSLTNATTDIIIKCNNSENLKVSIGYKTPNEELMDASNPDKEIIVWTGQDNFPEENLKSLSKGSTTRNELVGKWDLLNIGFTTTDYVYVGERIWFLKIRDMSEGPYGYERILTEEINGTLVEIPDYQPNINYLEYFAISFNELTFQTLLHPYFDGSCDIVVPIRGVNHEVVIPEEETEQAAHILGTSWSTTTTTQGSIARWAVVFTTENYDRSEDTTFAVWAGYLFIFGEHPDSYKGHHPDGLFDFGYNVIYCSDGSESDLPTKTCAETDESFLKSMLTSADSVCDSNDRLIVFVHGHGGAGVSGHVTKTTNTYWFFGFRNVMKKSDYFNYIESITDDGTHVFLWVCCCHGNGMDDWSPSDHHYKLEVWSYKPNGFGMAYEWEEGGWKSAFWMYSWGDPLVWFACEADLFFTNVESGPDGVTDVGDDIEYWFDNTLHDGDPEEEAESDMRTITYWGTYLFYV